MPVSPRASTPLRRGRSVRPTVRRAVAALVVAVSLSPTLVMATGAPAGAANATSAATSIPSGRVPAPGLAYETADSDVDGAALETRAFHAPANTAFRLDFDASVDTDTRRVLETAAGIWSEVLDLHRPIDVDIEMDRLDPGLLGAAGPTSAFFGRPEFPESDILYPVGLANQLSRKDLEPGRPDIQMVLALDVDWDRSIDGTATGQSMLAVALHELGHGLGLTSWVRETEVGHVVNYRVQGVDVTLAYDRLVETLDGTSISDMDEAALQFALTDQLFWGGAAATLVNGGPVAIYAPEQFQTGSSIGHLDEVAFGRELMTPFLGRRESHTAIAPLTTALLADIGWSVRSTGADARPAPEAQPAKPMATSPTGQAEAFVTAVVGDFLGRAPTATELTRWREHLRAGRDRAEVTAAFAFSDEWIGVIVDDLYTATLGRTAEPRGRSHWINVIRSGTSPAAVASFFYASDEYHARAGGTDDAWVADLYERVLRRSDDAAASAFWAARSRSLGRTAVAYEIFQSRESRNHRVQDMFDTLLGRSVEPSGLAYWTDVLTDGRDVELAMFLAASDEYYARASTRSTGATR